MKQVWPRPAGYTDAAEVCTARTYRSTFCHPWSTGWIPAVVFSILGVFFSTTQGVRPLGWLILAAAVALVIASAVSWSRLLREDRIAHTGVEAWASVTELKAGRAQINFRRPYKLQYRYVDAQGTQHDGRVRVVGVNWDQFKGQPVLVRYDPQHPEQSALVWLEIRDASGVPV